MKTFKGVEYLKIDIANQYGLDKQPYADRIAWVDEHEEYLEELVGAANKPFQYLAAVMAFRDAQQGIPTGHLVGFDACASGLQIMAALTGCKTTAENTGLTGNKRADVYGRTTEVMSQLLGSSVEIDRKDVKKASMRHFYGSKRWPKIIFGEGTDEFNAFYAANLIVAPGASELMDVLLASWQPYAMSHDWTMPDGFEVHVKVMVPVDTKIEVDELDHASFTYRHEVNAGTEKGLSIAANCIHSCDSLVVREMGRRCNYNSDQLIRCWEIIDDYMTGGDSATGCEEIEKLAVESGFYSLVAVEHINKHNVYDFSTEYLEKIRDLIKLTLGRTSFPMIFIHDEFKSHPNNLNILRQTYNEIMAEIADSNMLEFMLSQIQGNPTTIEKYSENLGELVREANYALS